MIAQIQDRLVEMGVRLTKQPQHTLSPTETHHGEATLKFRREAVLTVVQFFSRIHFFATPWTAACQASQSFTISQLAQTHGH